jgi:hypothetical protein
MQVAADPEHPNKHHGTPPSPLHAKVSKRQQEEKVEELQPVGTKLF